MKGGVRKHEHSTGRLCFFEQNLVIHAPTHKTPQMTLLKCVNHSLMPTRFSSEQSGQLFSVCYVLRAPRPSVSRLNREEIQQHTMTEGSSFPFSICK